MSFNSQFAWVNGFALVPAILCALLMSASALGRPAAAQEIHDRCSFDRCGVRIEPGGFFSGERIVAGREGDFVSMVRRSPELRHLFEPVDSASFYYASFELRDLQAQRIGRLGLVLYAAGAGLYIARQWRHDDLVIGLQFGGLALAIASTGPRRAARGDLARAIWWYNRDLPR